jgi:signal transduction histidine kinase
MTPSAMTSGAASPGVMRWLWRDRPLLSACAIGALLIGYQLGVSLLRPPWIGPVTDWLRAALAWPELAVVVGVSLRVTRSRQADARSWWMVSLGLLSYAVARTLWTVADALIFPHGVPFPSFPDLFFVLQYPFFFLAVMLMPSAPPWGRRLKWILDCTLWIGAATTLSWYFILAPRYMQSGMSPLAKLVCLAYPVGDLALIFGLVVALLRPSRSQADRLALYGLCSALACLILADTWVNVLLLVNPRHVYVTGNPPDLFWLAFYLLVPLAALVRLRVADSEPPKAMPVQAPHRRHLQPRDLLASLRFLCPFVAALLTSAVITIHAALTSASGGRRSVIAPDAVSLGLLLLVIVRQGIASLETEQLRRDREVARAHTWAMREANRHMEEFLSILCHEFKTPLTSLKGNVQLLTRRLRKTRLADEEMWRPEELAGIVAMVRSMAEPLGQSIDRLGYLVDELLDESSIQSGRLELRPAPCDLSAIVRAAVEEQRQLAEARTIDLEVPDTRPVLVTADAGRIEQVVTNYLSNALKYSPEDRPVTTRLRVEGEMARVSVRDEGIGVPAAEQAHIWERFHRAEGSTVQSGSDIGVGVGLHISKTIVEGHHGQVGVHSAPGQGSTFWFTLPVARSDRPRSEGGTETSRTGS